MSSNKEPKVAYFCMEYGLDKAMRIYAGGLGILAGDILKAAKELNKPMIGIGILWRQGYTKQLIAEDGRPYDSYHNNDYMYKLLDDTGITVTVRIRDEDIICKVWKLQRYDNVPLYLLDTNHKKNANKWITGQLYGWFAEERIAQELILGVGGIKLIRKLGLNIDIYHFNEGHAVFAGIELIREKIKQGQTFDEALAEVRKKIVFTTHTPVKEGNEKHRLDSIRYMGGFRGLPLEQMVKIGGAPFNMTVAGLRLSKIANAVAELHAVTARKMWEHVDNKSPIIAITNGVHHKTWVDQRIREAYDQGKLLWPVHHELKKELIKYIKQKTGVNLSSDKLLIGFARRAAPYKRSDLIFSKSSIIGPYLKEGKIQLVFSGKAHPLDDKGKRIISSLVKMSKKYQHSIVFLEDYNMEIGKKLTRGVDLWLNNPRRPKEASGTSGMKAAMNGVLNMSVLDGWWPEACEDGVNGWQFGDGYQDSDQDKQDEHDLKALYEVLLNKVVPTYYHNRERWEEMMKASIESTYERFSAKRMLKRYYKEIYTF
ncbi:alpha-glucan family phosphorylase [Halocella sp. SP3-1]|uniref:alpha-glucan family phosphorylase n=1 Tax=Halocella sp. SP3-1 TaxID=2382161 RepID=UPI000F74DAB7|nr:alpha-glucan family phosphorylase [Halocella sp. SP3-1]AZO93165.1 alpha-glucan family phosphorylase [Halocella sp. SP3-1]